MLLLSGTPLQNHSGEVYSLLHLLDDRRFRDEVSDLRYSAPTPPRLPHPLTPTPLTPPPTPTPYASCRTPAESLRLSHATIVRHTPSLPLYTTRIRLVRFLAHKVAPLPFVHFLAQKVASAHPFFLSLKA